MGNRPKSLQDLQRSGGINLTPKDRLYLKGVVLGAINTTHGEKMRYLIKRKFLTRSHEWTALGQAAVKGIKDELKRTQG